MTTTTKLAKPTPAQLALLDQIARQGYFTAKQWRTSHVLIREGWIHQKLEPGRTKVDGSTPWYLTDLGSDVREAAQQ
jgi:hypothetical protein